ncbi:hypothetical protein CERSUDRAFT_123772 [Gelatoporia subvermispora B]|uniref:FAD-binding PCMH-type domain-containing protein n=1 Tax=Ceriporiopsis subvermispora (strain B) TaxID=914234 RepID=M2RCY7_CERS8|nr:hypothetical protein CERSUDRAFT_123772 [Gelatoporia subvermispora B]
MANRDIYGHTLLNTRSSPAENVQSSQPLNTHISAGAAVGIVIGALAALSLITLLVIYTYRRRARLQILRHVDAVTIVKPSHKAAMHLDLNAAHPVDEEKSLGLPGDWGTPTPRWGGTRGFLVAPSPYVPSDSVSEMSYPYSYNPPSVDTPLSRPSSAFLRGSTPDLTGGRDPFARSPPMGSDVSATPLKREVQHLREEIRRLKATIEGTTTKSSPSFTVANASASDLAVQKLHCPECRCILRALPADERESNDKILLVQATSDQSSSCSVEPGTPEDVGAIVKGGGHATNPGFSSTPGVQIAMSRFSEVTLDADARTVRIGTGVLWDDMYSIVEPLGFNIVGYSFLTNQHGLTIDTVLEYELVLPNGTVTNVTAESDPDLSFALRGIVTSLTLQAYPQEQIWGGLIVMDPGTFDQFNSAVLHFIANVTDPKVGIIATFTSMSGTVLPITLLFYDAPTPPDGIFDDFLEIPAIEQNIGTRSILSLIQAGGNVTGFRSPWAVFASLADQSQFWSERLTSESAALLTWAVELFLPCFLSKQPDIASTYPPTRAQAFLPLCLSFQWNESSADATMRDAIKQSAAHLTAVAIAEGQDIGDAPVYGNYAIDQTPLSRIFGEPLPRLRDVKERYDLQDVMGLSGGWKV